MTNIMLAQLSEIGVIIHVRVSKSVDAHLLASRAEVGKKRNSR